MPRPTGCCLYLLLLLAVREGIVAVVLVCNQESRDGACLCCAPNSLLMYLEAVLILFVGCYSIWAESHMRRCLGGHAPICLTNDAACNVQEMVLQAVELHLLCKLHPKSLLFSCVRLKLAVGLRGKIWPLKGQGQHTNCGVKMSIDVIDLCYMHNQACHAVALL